MRDHSFDLARVHKLAVAAMESVAPAQPVAVGGGLTQDERRRLGNAPAALLAAMERAFRHLGPDRPAPAARCRVAGGLRAGPARARAVAKCKMAVR